MIRETYIPDRIDVAMERERDGGGGGRHEWEQEQEESDDWRPHGSHGGGRRQQCDLKLCFSGWCEQGGQVFIAVGFGA